MQVEWVKTGIQEKWKEEMKGKLLEQKRNENLNRIGKKFSLNSNPNCKIVLVAFKGISC